MGAEKPTSKGDYLRILPEGQVVSAPSQFTYDEREKRVFRRPRFQAPHSTFETPQSVGPDLRRPSYQFGIRYGSSESLCSTVLRDQQPGETEISRYSHCRLTANSMTTPPSETDDRAALRGAWPPLRWILMNCESGIPGVLGGSMEMESEVEK